MTLCRPVRHVTELQETCESIPITHMNSNHIPTRAGHIFWSGQRSHTLATGPEPGFCMEGRVHMSAAGTGTYGGLGYPPGNFEKKWLSEAAFRAF